ncbi:hypothetical protein A2U01_0077153, partial [Trifolium medium]|nr:hypothetical protein [Trifolium medium]
DGGSSSQVVDLEAGESQPSSPQTKGNRALRSRTTSATGSANTVGEDIQPQVKNDKSQGENTQLREKVLEVLKNPPDSQEAVKEDVPPPAADDA